MYLARRMRKTADHTDKQPGGRWKRNEARKKSEQKFWISTSCANCWVSVCMCECDLCCQLFRFSVIAEDNLSFATFNFRVETQ